MCPNPLGRLHALDLPFPLHCGTAGTVLFAPNESPWSVLSREMTLRAIGSIVILDTLGKVLGLTDVQLAARIFQNVNLEHKIGSAGRNKRTFKLFRLLADFLILLRNSHIRGFTLFPPSPPSALSCALVVTAIHGAY